MNVGAGDRRLGNIILFPLLILPTAMELLKGHRMLRLSLTGELTSQVYASSSMPHLNCISWYPGHGTAPTNKSSAGNFSESSSITSGSPSLAVEDSTPAMPAYSHHGIEGTEMFLESPESEKAGWTDCVSMNLDLSTPSSCSTSSVSSKATSCQSECADGGKESGWDASHVEEQWDSLLVDVIGYSTR